MDKEEIFQIKKKLEDLLKKEPENKDARFSLAALYYNLGNSFLRQKKFDDAIKNYLKSIESNKEFILSYYNLGNTYKEKNDLEKAIKYFQKTTKLDPNKIPAKINLAVAYSSSGNSKECIKNFEDLLSKNNYKSNLNHKMEADIRYSLGIELLREGNYEEGLKNYEYRLEASDYPLIVGEYKKKPKSLNEIKNKKILAVAEQGFGDVFQFIRYLKLLEKYTSEVYLQCNKKLFRILSCMKSIKKFYNFNEKVENYDFCVPLMSLPYLFKTNLKNIPNFPYIFPEEKLVNEWEDKLKEKKNFRIGLFWQGNIDSSGSIARAIKLKDLEILLDFKKVDFISLQKGDGHEQIKESRFSQYMIDNHDNIDTGQDAFIDTAAMIKNLDLIISSDTSIVHLSGAIGKKVWMLEPKVPNWPWTNYGKTSPWYKSLEIFRQKKKNNWEQPIKDVKNKLLKILH